MLRENKPNAGLQRITPRLLLCSVLSKPPGHIETEVIEKKLWSSNDCLVFEASIWVSEVCISQPGNMIFGDASSFFSELERWNWKIQIVTNICFSSCYLPHLQNGTCLPPAPYMLLRKTLCIVIMFNKQSKCYSNNNFSWDFQVLDSYSVNQAWLAILTFDKLPGNGCALSHWLNDIFNYNVVSLHTAGVCVKKMKEWMNETLPKSKGEGGILKSLKEAEQYLVWISPELLYLVCPHKCALVSVF